MLNYSRLIGWSKNTPSIFKAVAESFALKTYELSGETKNDLSPIQRKDIKSWIELYYNHRMLWPFWIKILLKSDDSGPIYKAVNQILQRISASDEMSFQQIADAFFGNSKSLKCLFYNELRQHSIKDVPNIDESDLKKLSSHDVDYNPMEHFVERVWLPCIFIFAQYPGFMFRKARHGDIDAICKLLRLDKGVLGDRRIFDHVTLASLDPNSPAFSKISRAFSQGPPNLSEKRMKLTIIGFIMYFASVLDMNIKVPILQNLFDVAYARFNKGGLADPDLPDTPHSFYMSVKNKADLFRSALKPQKK